MIALLQLLDKLMLFAILASVILLAAASIKVLDAISPEILDRLVGPV